MKNMISFTAYANKKFEILKRHECVIMRENVRAAVEDAIGEEKDARKKLFFAQKNIGNERAVRVVYKKEEGAAHIITFYPISCNE